MQPISNDGIKQLFTEARTINTWLAQEVPDQTLHEIYDLMKWGPTSANTCPARIAFVRRGPEKEKLIAALDAGNVEKVRASPVTAIIAQDEKFYEQSPRLFPQAPDIKDFFAANPTAAATAMLRNSSLQGAYFILAVRALGLDAGPMSGFNNAKLDEIFFSGSSWKSNFICNLGYGDRSKLHPRNPRLTFEEACKILL